MKRLNYMISDEKSAPNKYKTLLKSIKGKSNKKLIRSIIRDERRHRKLLIKIKRRMK